MSESQFEAGRVKFDQHLGPCVGDWYEMKDGGRRRFGRDLGESLRIAADPSGRCFSLDADGNATYNGPLLDQFIQKSSLGKPLEWFATTLFGPTVLAVGTFCRPHGSRCADRLGRVKAVAARSAGARSASLDVAKSISDLAATR